MSESKPDVENLDNCLMHCTIGIFGGSQEDIIKNAIENDCRGPLIRKYVADTALNDLQLTGVDTQIACGTARPIPGLDDIEFSPFDEAPIVGPYELSQEQIRTMLT